MNNFIKVSRDPSGVATVTLSRPEALNALNQQVLKELKITLQELSRDETARVLILRGDGDKAFVAGADIKEMQEMNRGQASDFSKLGHEVFFILENMPKAVIAAVHGFALGGGFELALACDFIIASEKAQFGLPEVSLGVIPGFGGTIRLSRAIGTPKAKEMIFSGVRIKAEEARLTGLVRQVLPHDKFFDEVMEFSKKIAANSMTAIMSAKKLLNEFGESTGLNQKSDAEVHQFGSQFGGIDQKEGMGAFLEKRAPKFKGM